MVVAAAIPTAYAAAPAGAAARTEILGRVGAVIPRRGRCSPGTPDGVDTVGVPEPIHRVDAAAKAADTSVGALSLQHVTDFAKELSAAGIHSDVVSPKLLPDYRRKK